MTPPKNKLGMRDPVPMTGGKPSGGNPSDTTWSGGVPLPGNMPSGGIKPLDDESVQKLIATGDLEKLKRPPTTSDQDMPSVQFDKSQQSPHITTEKHINHVLANQKVFDAIERRMRQFTPQIVLGDHIVNSWEKIEKLSKLRFMPVIAHRDVLNGIDFIVEDREKLLLALRDAKVGTQKGFKEGSSSGWKDHWPLTISFMATDGIGFREVFRPRFNDRPLDQMPDLPFDTRMGRDLTIDISALHVAVSGFPQLGQVRCNIHIDQMTVTLEGMGDSVQISPSVISHFINELLFKTKLQGKLPDWILDAFDFSLFNPDEGGLNMGVMATIVNKPHFKWTLNFSVGLNNNVNKEWSGEFKLQKAFGTGIAITW